MQTVASTVRQMPVDSSCWCCSLPISSDIGVKRVKKEDERICINKMQICAADLEVRREGQRLALYIKK